MTVCCTPCATSQAARTPGAVGTPVALPIPIMTQTTLVEMSKQVSLTDEIIAVNFRGIWEIYVRDYTQDDGTWDSYLERFSHYATAGEVAQIETAGRLA